jgi:hypothetical protein
MDRQKAENIARKKINKDHTLGESVGGSGHIGYTALKDFGIQEIIPVSKNNRKYWKISYEYTLATETEFTIAPDHLPSSHRYSKTIVVDNKDKIVEDVDV